MNENQTPGWFGSRWKTYKEPTPNPEVKKTVREAMADGTLSRQELLKLIGIAVTGTGARKAEWEGVERFVDAQREQRGEEVADMSAFLRGEQLGDTLEMFGGDWDYEEFVGLVSRMTTPHASKEEVRDMLASFATIVETSDALRNPWETLPILEEVDDQAERDMKKALPLATKFGYGQISPAKAKAVALAYRSEFERFSLLTKEQLAQLEQEQIPARDIVKQLELRRDGNVLLSALAFYAGYDAYSRNSAGRISNRQEQDPRAFALSVAAYEAGINAPRIAKIQTVLNELFIADRALGNSALRRSKKEMGSSLLPVDGRLDSHTLQALERVGEILSLQVPKELFAEGEPVDPAQLDACSKLLFKEWGRKKELIQPTRSENALQLRELVGNRYSTLVKTYVVLSELAGDRQSDVRRWFYKYIDHKDPTFLDFLINPVLLQKHLPAVDYETFRSSVARTVVGSLNFDNHYPGVIPIDVRTPSNFGGEPQNMLVRTLVELEPKIQ